MYIIEYVQNDKLYVIVCQDEVEARRAEYWLVSLRTVSLVIVWGVL